MSRKIVPVGVLLCCVLTAGKAPLAQTPPSALQQQMIAADRGIYESLAGPRPDVAKLGTLLAPEYSEVDDGQINSRADFIQQASAISQFTFKYSDPVAVSTSPNTGYVVATVRYSFRNGVYSYRHYYKTTTALVLRDGRWMATIHSESQMPFDSETIRETPDDSDPLLIALRKLAVQVMSEVHVPGYAPFPYYNVSLDAGMGVSYSNAQGAHEADFSKLPPPMQQIWNQWASYTTDEPSGQALFEDMFYRFFFVHELGHLIAARVIGGLPEAEQEKVWASERSNRMEAELVANRIATAWFREHDPQYLVKLVADFKLIQSRLPNPVPAGVDPKRYFTENYKKLGADPIAYGWYQLYMVITVYNEPATTFQQTLAALPNERYTED